MNESKLKACPFCGGKPTVRQLENNRPKQWVARCNDAMCQVNPCVEAHSYDGLLAIWNHRAGDREPATSKAAEDKHVGISDGLGGYNVSTVIKKYPDARCKKSASGKHFIVESVCSTIGKGPTPQAAWNDAASICDSNLKELIEWAWGIISNAGGGDWEKESAEWREAAKKWRDEYHETLNPPNKQI